MTAAPHAEPFDEIELSARLASGDEHAFALLAGRYSAVVFRFTRRMLGSAEDAEDATQEAFMELYKNRARLKPGVSPLPYLYTVARRKAINKLRWRAVRSLVSPMTEADENRLEASGECPRRSLDEQRAEAALQRALNGLKPDKRAVVILRFFEERTYAEIAAIMNKPEGAVKSLAFRAERELRDRLPDDWMYLTTGDTP